MIEAAFRIAVGVLALFAVGAFLLGYIVGAKQESKKANSRITVVMIVMILIIVGGAIPVALTIGRLVMEEAGALAAGLGFALLGGFLGGRLRQIQQQSNSRYVLIAAVLVCLLSTTIALRFIATKNNQLLRIVKELGYDRPREQKAAPDTSKNCTQSLSEIYKGFVSYVNINDALPPAAKWLDEEDFLSGVQANEWLHCPAVSNRKDDKYGYAFNEALAGKKLGGKKLAEIPDAAKTPLVFDSTNLAKNAHDNLTSLPKPGRHNGLNNILYCDGHIESVAPK